MNATPMTGKALIEEWVTRFNAADAEGLARLYSEQAVNHQIPVDPVRGREDIRRTFEQEFATTSMTCIVEQILEAGEWVVLEWRDPLGLRGCGFFRVRNGLIESQRGYWDRLSFVRLHGLPIPS